jgi:ribosomal protein S18 acetylase RimI-like enzyme
MLISDGFDVPLAQAYDLICAIYRASNEFSASLDEVFPDVQAFQAYLTTLRQRPGAVFLIAREQQLCGFLLLNPRAEARLSHAADLKMGILPAFRGQGVGQRLLAHAFELAIDEGMLEILYLMVRADNPSALHLYEKSGFIRKAVLDKDSKIDGHYIDGILMSKSLIQAEAHDRFGGTLQMGGEEELHPRSP